MLSLWQLMCWGILMTDSLLFLMASLVSLMVYWGNFDTILFLFNQSVCKNISIGLSSSGIRGNLQESESYTALNLIATGAVIGSILICLHGLTGIVGLRTLARFTRSEFILKYTLFRDWWFHEETLTSMEPFHSTKVQKWLCYEMFAEIFFGEIKNGSSFDPLVLF